MNYNKTQKRVLRYRLAQKMDVCCWPTNQWGISSIPFLKKVIK